MKLYKIEYLGPCSDYTSYFHLGGHFEPNRLRPLIYFKKPKWMSTKQYKVLCRNISIQIDDFAAIKEVFSDNDSI